MKMYTLDHTWNQFKVASSNLQFSPVPFSISFHSNTDFIFLHFIKYTLCIDVFTEHLSLFTKSHIIIKMILLEDKPTVSTENGTLIISLKMKAATFAALWFGGVLKNSFHGFNK